MFQKWTPYISIHMGGDIAKMKPNIKGEFYRVSDVDKQIAKYIDVLTQVLEDWRLGYSIEESSALHEKANTLIEDMVKAYDK